MPSAFGRWVKERLESLKISQRAFGARVGISHSNLNKIINGSHEAPPPPLGIECGRWAEALEIPDDQIKRFYLYAACAHIPMPARVEFEGIIHEHLAMYDRFPAMVQQVRRAAEQSPLIYTQFPPPAEP